MILIKSFITSIVFIAIFIFVDALFVNWSLPINLCIAIGATWFTTTLWKWTANIISFKKSGMKLPEEPEKKNDDDDNSDPGLADLRCNIWHGTALDRTSDYWFGNPFEK